MGSRLTAFPSEGFRAAVRKPALEADTGSDPADSSLLPVTGVLMGVFMARACRAGRRAVRRSRVPPCVV